MEYIYSVGLMCSSIWMLYQNCFAAAVSCTFRWVTAGGCTCARVIHKHSSLTITWLQSMVEHACFHHIYMPIHYPHPQQYPNPIAKMKKIYSFFLAHTHTYTHAYAYKTHIDYINGHHFVHSQQRIHHAYVLTKQNKKLHSMYPRAYHTTSHAEYIRTDKTMHMDNAGT